MIAWPLSYTRKVLDRNLYLCVLTEGLTSEGTPCYAYFGVFLDKLPAILNAAEEGKAFNPKDYGAIVLARSTGLPSPEIRDFMRMKFSFTEDRITLEVSQDRAH